MDLETPWWLLAVSIISELTGCRISLKSMTPVTSTGKVVDPGRGSMSLSPTVHTWQLALLTAGETARLFSSHLESDFYHTYQTPAPGVEDWLPHSKISGSTIKFWWLCHRLALVTLPNASFSTFHNVVMTLFFHYTLTYYGFYEEYSSACLLGGWRPAWGTWQDSVTKKKKACMVSHKFCLQLSLESNMSQNGNNLKMVILAAEAWQMPQDS